MMSLRHLYAVAALAAISTGALAQGEAPATGGTAAQVPSPVTPSGPYQPTDKDERGLWMQVDEYERDLKNSNFVIRDPALNAYVRGVLCRSVGEAACGETRIYLQRTPFFNASMAPNGMMQVWSGLLLRMRNEAELAAVLAHEFGHYKERHSLQLFREIRKKTDAMAWLSFIPYGTLAQIPLIGMIFANSREMEREADALSIAYLDNANYDPAATAAIWERLRQEADATAAARKHRSRKDRNGGFFGTHPTPKDRMQYLSAAAAIARDAGDELGRERYRAALGDWWPRLVEDQVKLADFGGTEYLINQLAQDGWTSELLYARAENHRTRGKAGDYEAAIAHYRSALALPSPLAENWRGLGLALMKAGQIEEGKAALRSYLGLRPQAEDRALLAGMSA